MQLDQTIRVRYIKAVENLLAETLALDEKEFAVQEKIWSQLVTTNNTDQPYWQKFLETGVRDGYLARWISILLAPSETLRPYAWPTDITIPKQTAEDLLTVLDGRENATRLKEFMTRLCELNASFDMTHAW